MAKVYNFTVKNEDIVIRFSCPNHGHRISEIVKNLCIDSSDSRGQKISRFTSLNGPIVFTFDGIDAEDFDIRHEAVFFENTEYPLIVKGAPGKHVVSISLDVNEHRRSDDGSKSTIISDDGELYGSLNFRNQVGMTDFTFTYFLKGDDQPRTLKFMTEVLSYKLDYRSDLRTIIGDIEREYALLSASFLKDTYLSIRQAQGESNSLIWWQIFKSCYKDIIAAAKIIIDRPKRRLRSVPKYERIERMPMLPRELENEYQVHKNNPSHLYRTEDLILSHDTIENRFLKHALSEMLRRFISIKSHIMTAMHLDDPKRIDRSIDDIEGELLRLTNNSFFRGVGPFKGFTQDNLVMKQAVGYKTIMEKWIELQQGYELEEGLRKLEVKDISDLYEIWCFIKVKNIVQETLVELGHVASPMSNGRYISNDFIPQLAYGGTLNFIDSDNIELACVSYNAEVEKVGTTPSSIDGTSTITTIQRPDIVLRLSKTDIGTMKYTYLFDAKYRIDDNKIGGQDVPPEDSIDQMHRYRDAIYYTEEGHDREHLKKEIIAGYVLFPGKVSSLSLDASSGDYYYQKSNRLIGIGAFPLRPAQEIHAADGSVIINPESSEQALRYQIRKWLEDSTPREHLLETSIPQKGLEYSDEPVSRGTYFLSKVDEHVNSNSAELVHGKGIEFYSGYSAILSGFDFQKIKYLLPVDGSNRVFGYYDVSEISTTDASILLKDDKIKRETTGKGSRYSGYDKPIRIKFTLGKFHKLPHPFIYGITNNSLKGVILNRSKFIEYRDSEQHAVKDEI